MSNQTQNPTLAPPAYPKVDLRQEPRIATQKQVSIRLYTFGGLAAPQSAVLCDRSINGVGLIVCTPVHMGKRFIIHSEHYTYALAYNSLRCQSVDGSSFRVGARLHGVVMSEGQATDYPDVETVRAAIFGDASGPH